MSKRKCDLISREWLKDTFDNLCCHNCKICRNFRNEDSFYKCNLIENAPTVESRPHGEWIRHADDLFPEESTEECSVCHEEQRITGNDDNFCPNCGADMREGEENES